MNASEDFQSQIKMSFNKFMGESFNTVLGTLKK